MITANQEEIQQNPRSRSAKLRIGIRTEAESLAADMKLFSLAEIARFEGNKMTVFVHLI